MKEKSVPVIYRSMKVSFPVMSSPLYLFVHPPHFHKLQQQHRELKSKPGIKCQKTCSSTNVH